MASAKSHLKCCFPRSGTCVDELEGIAQLVDGFNGQKPRELKGTALVLTQTTNGRVHFCFGQAKVSESFISDVNHVKHENVCVPVVPESIPAGACHSNQGWYLGPSGYRFKAGNTCNKQRGVIKDAPVRKDCARPQLPEGEIGHTVFQFPKEIVQFEYLGESEVLTSQIPFDVSVY